MTQERSIKLHALVGLSDIYRPISVRFSEDVADYLEVLEVIVDQMMRNLDALPEPPNDQEVVWSMRAGQLEQLAGRLKAEHALFFRAAERAAALLKTIEAIPCPPTAEQVKEKLMRSHEAMIKAIQLQEEGWQIMERHKALPIPDAARCRFEESTRLNLEETPRLLHDFINAIDALSEGQISAWLKRLRESDAGGGIEASPGPA